MNAYLLSIYFLLVATLCQSLAGFWAFLSWRQPGLPRSRRRTWLAFGLASVLLALHHGHTLSLATHTGLYDFRQAALAVLGGALYAYAVVLLRRPA